MPRVLITGASGFAGRHLTDACRAAGDDISVVSQSAGHDLGDPEQTREIVAAAAPEFVFHLAAQAHVGRSWQEPAETLHGNLALTLNLLEAVRHEAPGATVIAVASGEVYGPPEQLPVDETAHLHPQNPYAVSKAAADLLAGFYADGHGLRVLRPRPFNHSGPGQQPSYAIASFARQVAAGLEAGDDPVRVVTGNPHTSRDYTDVRDVVRAYRLLAASDAPAGTVVNVCSGRPASAGELVRTLGQLARVEVIHEIDPSLVRAHEVMEVRGSYARLRDLTGWEPKIDLHTTLRDTVAWWREQIRSGAAPA